MYEVGDRVVVKDGSGRHGAVGIVDQHVDGIVYVLLEFGVIWPVAAVYLEPAPIHPPVALFAAQPC